MLETHVFWLTIIGFVAVMLMIFFKPFKLLNFSTFFMFAIALVSFSQSSFGSSSTGNELRIKKIEVFQPKFEALGLQVKTQGFLSPTMEIEVSSELSGRITHTASDFFVGTIIPAGTTIFAIDNSAYHLAVEQARYQLAEAEKQLAIERGLGKQAKSSWEDLGNVASNDLFTRKPHLKSAAQKVQFRETELKQALLNLERTKVALPFPVQISGVKANIGQFIEPGDTVVSVINPFHFRATLPITDKQAQLLDMRSLQEMNPNSLEVSAKYSIGKEVVSLQGFIRAIEPRLDSKTKTYNLVGVFDLAKSNNEMNVKPVSGTYIDALIQGSTQSTVIQLPNSAFTGTQYIYIVNNGSIERVAVELVQRDNKYAWVRPLEHLRNALIVIDSTMVIVGDKVEPVFVDFETVSLIN